MHLRHSELRVMQAITSALVLAALTMWPRLLAQSAPKTLVAVFAHADDEGSAAPILARYAREGVQVYLIIATDGAQGGTHTTIPRGPELARVRAEEARCAASALGIHEPILLGFPDANLGTYLDDRERLQRVTTRILEELQRLRPDALISWGPDGGSGHPDHRLVSSIVTQLVRAGAPGTTERLFYVSFPEEAVGAVNPDRGERSYLTPLPKYVTARIPFSPADFDASRRSMACHRTQYSDDVIEKLSAATRDALKGELPLSPWILARAATDLFR